MIIICPSKTLKLSEQIRDIYSVCRNHSRNDRDGHLYPQYGKADETGVSCTVEIVADVENIEYLRVR